MKALDVILAHAASTMPDSLAQRREILRAMEKILTHEHEALAAVQSQLAALDAIDALQAELPLKFQPSPQTHTGKHNGDGQAMGGQP